MRGLLACCCLMASGTTDNFLRFDYQGGTDEKTSFSDNDVDDMP